MEWMSEAVPLQEQADRLEVSYPAVQRASLRAQDRFREVFRLLSSS